MTRRAWQDEPRAVLLLEVVVALTVMVLAMGLLGGQLAGGLRLTGYAEEQTRAMQLADRMLALLELDPNTIERFAQQRELEGDFGEQYPGWFWRVLGEEFDEQEQITTEGFGRITLQILHCIDQGEEDEGDIEEARVVRELHLLKADPPAIDLEADFGLLPEQAEMFKLNLPPDAFDEEGKLDIGRLVQFTGIEDLFTMLPLFMSLAQGGSGLEGLDDLLGSGDLSGLSDLFGQGGVSPADLAEIVSQAGVTGGAELGDLGGNEAIIEMIRSQIGDQIGEQELGNLLTNIGRQRQGGPPGDHAREPNQPRRGRGIEDLDGERDERNRKWKGR